MGKRSTARRLAMQALFQADSPESDPDLTLNALFEEEDFVKETKTFAQELVKGTWVNLKEIDAKIKNHLKNWSFDRINSVDKSILRFSIYEILFLKQTPPAVVINEALELAKKYSDEDSAKFINGILGALVSGSKELTKE